MKAIVRDSNLGDALKMSTNLRKADYEELRAGHGNSVDPAFILKEGIETSDTPKTVEYNNEPIAIFGVVNSTVDNPNMGWVWLLGTDKIKEIKIQFLRESKEHLAQQEKKYDILANYVDARNEVHIKWLRWLGFNFIRKIENFGVENRPFYEFARINTCVTQ